MDGCRDPDCPEQSDHGPGHNSPPADEYAALRERIAERHADILSRRDALLSARDKILKIDSAEAAGRAADYIKMLRVAEAKLDDIKDGERQPFDDAAYAVCGVLDSEPLQAAEYAVGLALHDWRMAHPDIEIVGEYGATAHGRAHLVITIDRTTLDLEALRKYIPAAALETAGRAARKDSLDVRGVTVTETSKTVVR